MAYSSIHNLDRSFQYHEGTKKKVAATHLTSESYRRPPEHTSVVLKHSRSVCRLAFTHEKNSWRLPRDQAEGRVGLCSEIPIPMPDLRLGIDLPKLLIVSSRRVLSSREGERVHNLDVVEDKIRSDEGLEITCWSKHLQ
jgi:hypothetical protein